MGVTTPITSHPRSRRRKVNPYFKEFLGNTSLHGLKYIGDPNKHLIERCFWCIVLISFIISLHAIYKMKIDQWKESPSTIEVGYTRQHISTLASPAVTFCGSLGLSQEIVKSLMSNREDVDSMYKIADILGMTREAFDNMYHSLLNSTDYSTQNNIDNEDRYILSDSTLEKLNYSLFKDVLFVWAERFCFQTFTFRGLCMSCNMVPPSKIYRSDTVRNYFRKDSEQQEQLSNEFKFAYKLNTETIHGFPLFQVDLVNLTDPRDNYLWQETYPTMVEQPQMTLNVYGKCKDYYIGRDCAPMFTIHNPWDFPSPFMRWHRVALVKRPTFRINIDPEVILKYPMNDDDMLYKVPSARQCYNTTEKKLDFFQYYTRQNCLTECSTNRALEECGCVLFFMPHNESTYICSDKNSSCAMKVALDSHYENSVNSCDCLPSCNSTEYKVISVESDQHGVSQHTIEIIFRDDLFHPKIRTKSYTNYEMIDNTVFYLDVFLGVSILTVAEIFYYILLYGFNYLKSKIRIIQTL